MVKFVDDIANRRKFAKENYDLISACQFRDDNPRASFGWNITKAMLPDGLLGEHSIFHTDWTGQTIFANPDTGKSAVVLTSRRKAYRAAKESPRASPHKRLLSPQQKPQKNALQIILYLFYIPTNYNKAFC